MIREIFYHLKNKSGIDAQQLFSKSNNFSKIGRVYPDFISKNSNKRIIADAKYKPIENISNKDYLQVFGLYVSLQCQKRGLHLSSKQ
ncbi:5-methylcytosine restriction system specificity protein McrC [Leuconostoc mesenteroides]|uniref:5-methylcytosine restriction system specificity protein McrC n=1 Tax=Leuconostoc mesenteroides TaxID=1245 RepID=UPI00294346CB|nr:hypothetical protein [Leuconostoc mesenteroides]